VYLCVLCGENLGLYARIRERSPTEIVFVGVKRLTPVLLSILLLLAAAGCHPARHYRPGDRPPASSLRPLPGGASPALKQLVAGALDQVGQTTGYDPAYVKIDYPGGDVAPDTGVCADVIVRSFRNGGIDLQREVHEDMLRAWSEYPRKWNASGPDTNIDHRRVLNLRTWFTRQGKSLPVSSNESDYLPGDVVSWDLGNGLDHIGIVVNAWAPAEQHYLVVHNVGLGARAEDALFAWKITGHYRYFR